MRLAFKSYDKLLPLSSLKPNKFQRNKHPKEQIERLAKIMREHGVRHPIHISTRSKQVCFGHGRWEAAELNGWAKYPVVYQDFKSAKEEFACVQSDNAIAGWAELDQDTLKTDLKDFANLDIELLGIKDFSISEISEGKCDEDEVPEQVDTRCKLGDVWTLGRHRLMCGDSTSIDAVDALMVGEKADMVFTDPPYGIDVVQSNSVGGGGPTKFGTDGASKIVAAKTYRKIEGDENTNAAKDFYNMCVGYGFEKIVLFGGNYFTDFLPPSRCWLVWDKEMTGNFSQAEMAWTSLTVGGVRVFKFLWNGLSREGNRKDELVGRVHPTQKPVGLFAQIFERIECESIFDGFGGSGSTLIACEKTSRRCFMMELDPHYCDVILARWEAYTGKKAKLIEEKERAKTKKKIYKAAHAQASKP